MFQIRLQVSEIKMKYSRADIREKIKMILLLLENGLSTEH